MTQFRPKPLVLSACLVICTMIAAGSAEAKDIDAQPDKSSDAAPAATGTPKTRQIAVEPTAAEETPTEAKPSDKVAKAPASEPKISAPEKQVAADGEVEEEGDGASSAPEVKRLERPEPGPVHVYVHRYPRLMGMATADTDQPTKVP
jgi:hypothetical protein